MPGCLPEEDIPGDFIPPSASPSEPPEIVIPSGAAASNVFALAFSSSGTMNPITGISRLNSDFMPLVYEGLFFINDRYEAEPLLCSSFSKEGLKYTFHLNPDACFSDGTKLTADDVKYSLEFAISGSSVYGGRLKHVKRISAPEEDIVMIELDKDLGRFEQLLDIPVIKKGSDDMTYPIGTGAYIIVESEGESYLKANPVWWRKEVKPAPRIELIDTPEADLLINYFETGVISMVRSDLTATDLVVFGGDYEEWSYATSDMYYLGLNTAAGPFMRAETRRLMSFVVDRELICETEMLRYADPAVLPVNPASRLYKKEIEQKYAFSIDRFIEESIAEGYGEENPLRVVFIVNTENVFKVAVANRISEDLRAMGVQVELRELKWDNFLAALKSGNFDIYLAEVRLSPDFDISPLVSKEGALNYGKYSSEETEILLDSFLSADRGSIETAAAALYRKVAEDAPIIPILFKRGLVLAKRGIIEDISPLQGNIFNGLRM